MKDSGISWIGEMPATWKKYTLTQLFGQVKCKNVGMVEQNLLSLSYGRIINKDINTTNGLVPESFEGYNIIEPNDIVLRLTDLQNDHTSLRVGLSSQRGIITSAYLTIRNESENLPRFLYYQLHAFDICKGLYGMGAGVRQGLNWDGVKLLKLVVPSVDEQQRIVEALDHECAEIDAVIRQTKATVEEYKKLKQSIISDAVTKGIRGDRPMKDSGIPWIGKVPVEWDLCKTLYALLMPITDGPHTTPELFGEGIPFVSAEAVSCGNGKIDFDHIRGYISEEFYKECCAKYTPRRNDIYMIKSGATTGRVAYVDTDIKFNIWSPLAVFRANEERAYFKFLFYYLQSEAYQKEVQLGWTYGTQQNIGMRTLETLKLLLPSISEQVEIADYLDKECSKIDRLVSKKTALLAELENYKRSVIYEYVTGKKEVGAAEKSVTTIVYPYFPAVLSTKKARFAQAVLMSRILDKCRTKMGRVKLEKMLYTIETSIGFDFDTEYVRQAAGPLDESIYDCEAIISRRNKWYTKKESKYGVSYTPTKDSGHYKKYYDKYFADYDSEIERIIGIFMDYDADQAEIVATLFAAWNDFIIDRKEFTDEQLVDEVLNNWNDSKKRFSRDVWLRAIQQMRQNNIVPKGYGKRTVIKN